jgi:NAD(P)-dependent dehydrogenase (short-subunit alcohol dehydrogenase family)
MPTPEVPIGSGFNSASTAGEVIKGIDLAGKTAIVTRGYSGLGRETARELRAAGARVIVPARDPERATAALAGIDVEIESMDLLDPVAIDALAERYLTSGQPLHFLVNSAGIMANPLIAVALDECGKKDGVRGFPPSGEYSRHWPPKVSLG